MNSLVRITRDDNGEQIENAPWCLSVHYGGNMAFCSGQYYGGGESSAEYEIKYTQRKGITCESCLEKIREIKAVKL